MYKVLAGCPAEVDVVQPSPATGPAPCRPPAAQFTCGEHSPYKIPARLFSHVKTVGMRYVRFLKTPRVVHDKHLKAAHVSCLITITSDLGDSFLPYPLSLSAELLQNEPETGTATDPGCALTKIEELARTDKVITWRTIQWTEGMRSLNVTIPLSRNYKRKGPLVVRIGTEPKSRCDELGKLLLPESRGVVSVWSAPFNLRDESCVLRTVERRFLVGTRVHCILEETGESIARHVW